MNDQIEKLKEKVEKDPSSKLFVPLAEEYRKAGMFDEAIGVLEGGLNRQPDYLSARVALGKIFLEKGMKREAQSEFEKVVAAIPDNLYAQRKLADLYLEDGDTERAKSAFRNVLELHPRDEEARKTLDAIEQGVIPAGAADRTADADELPPIPEDVTGAESAGAEDELELPDLEEDAGESEGKLPEAEDEPAIMWAEDEGLGDDTFTFSDDDQGFARAEVERADDEEGPGGADEEDAGETTGDQGRSGEEEAEPPVYEIPETDETDIAELGVAVSDRLVPAEEEERESGELEDFRRAVYGGEETPESRDDDTTVAEEEPERKEPRDYLLEADRFVAQNRYEEAAALLKEALAEDPGNTRVAQRAEELAMLVALLGKNASREEDQANRRVIEALEALREGFRKGAEGGV